ncbi:unnamed protein product [Effrenium voratum]|nr:unnamed protein product [Effrenium voratum]
MAMAWWHLEGKSVLSQRLLLALAFQCFDETVLSDSPLDARESGLRRLQGLARLQQQLPRLSKEDAAGSLLSSYQSVVLAVCALLAQRSSRKALDFFLKEVPAADGDDRLMAMTMDAGPVRPTAATKAAAELARNWAKVAEHLVTLVQADAPSTQVEAIRICLRLDPGSPFALRALARLRVRQGRGAALRRELDTVLGLHRPTRLGASSAQWLESFRVALEAELSLEALGARARLGHLCEKALALASPIAGGGLWSLYGLVLLVKLHQDIAAGRKTGAGEELWRSSVRATSHQPLCKSLWLLNLAACEARGEGDAPEEEVIDLVEAIEAKQIFLRGDPLEAIA